ncbi:hypothetical protein [Desulfoglaeba alkanexedens]|uniref:Uncharacterized protein n=1 Tax=Desulfoglaeba alkanexedens ALDC TaxID=980445 RepID=A0A4P8L1D9_9BACT|nr:hypothetical protein [Desulfoglaeba alkanexedens]QCQ21676.1 hypothetical protein FDQ92_05470 [Desulfoglaeba alkanexedens ALDC]
MTRTSKSQFVWCKKENCFVPWLRCLLCRTPCRAFSEDVPREAVEALLQEGKIKEHYVMKSKNPPKESAPESSTRLFILEDGKLRTFDPSEYARSALYEAEDVYAVERRFVRPEEKSDVLYEGKRPAKKTVPLLRLKDSEEARLGDWQDLEARPEQLADVEEVIAAVPVKQVFVLRKK